MTARNWRSLFWLEADEFVGTSAPKCQLTFHKLAGLDSLESTATFSQVFRKLLCVELEVMSSIPSSTVALNQWERLILSADRVNNILKRKGDPFIYIPLQIVALSHSYCRHIATFFSSPLDQNVLKGCLFQYRNVSFLCFNSTRIPTFLWAKKGTPRIPITGTTQWNLPPTPPHRGYTKYKVSAQGRGALPVLAIFYPYLLEFSFHLRIPSIRSHEI